MKNCTLHGQLTDSQVYSNGQCKECVKISRRKHYEANKEKIKERVKEYRVNNLDKCKAYHEEYREVNKERMKLKSAEHYLNNKENIKSRTKSYYESNKEHLTEKARKWWKENTHRMRVISREYRIAHKEELAIKKREYYRALRREAISHYSLGTMMCAHCHHNNWTQLCLDHMEDGGTQHRLIDKGVQGHSVFSWVKKNGYPPIFQVLCYNCNLIKSLKPAKDSASKRSSDKIKQMVLSHYSADLKCPCGYSDIRALSLDHIEGGGRKKLIEMGLKGGSQFYRWVRRERYPDGLQVLCLNCNCGKNSVRNEKASTGRPDLPMP